MKLKLTLAYDGSKFQGSATQPHKNSVQDTLSSALARLGISAKPLFASRTDKGVHALANAASIECGEHFSDLNALKSHLNRHAHPHIHIKSIARVAEDFEVRFHAKARAYRYLLHHGEFSPFLSPYFHFRPNIDIARANGLLRHFIGTHDFKNFAKQYDKSTTRTMFAARAFAHGDITAFSFKADGFLRAQIRLMMSVLLKVLDGKMREDELLRQIQGDNFDENLGEIYAGNLAKNSSKNLAINSNEILTQNSSENLVRNSSEILSKNSAKNFAINSNEIHAKNFSRTLVPASGLYLVRVFY